MRRLRLLVLGCLLCGALALPAAALAGGSAGNQQYTDPFGSSPTTTHATQTQTQPQTQTQTAPATQTETQSAAPPPTQTTPPTSPSSGGVVTGNTGDPTTTAGPGTTTAPPGTDSTLPYTGFAIPVAAGFGAAMLAAGLLLRRRTGESR